jgi:hypothetical protein
MEIFCDPTRKKANALTTYSHSAPLQESLYPTTHYVCVRNVPWSLGVQNIFHTAEQQLMRIQDNF